MTTLTTETPALPDAPPAESPDADALAVARWKWLTGKSAARRRPDDLRAPYVNDALELTESERASASRRATLAGMLASAHAAGAAPRPLFDVAGDGARLAECPECGARANRRQCAPHMGYHVTRFIRAGAMGLITGEELALVIVALLKQPYGGRWVVRVGDLVLLDALAQAREAARAAGDDASGIAYVIIGAEIRDRMQAADDAQDDTAQAAS